jgi:hypothetical protein
VYENLDEELFLPMNFSNETILSSVNFEGIEMFNESREKSCLIRFYAMFQLILSNLPLIHLIKSFWMGFWNINP